jgi:TRAP-type C4-dicarboxylate transport system permease large subunit
VPDHNDRGDAGVSDNPIVILLLINLILLFLGTFMDMSPLIVITTPIFLPVATAFGVDPVHFGVIMVLNLGIGLCTPPVGAVLFVGCAVGSIGVGQVMRTIWPFYGAAFATLMLVTYIPGAVALAARAVPVSSCPIPSSTGPGVTRQVLSDTPT